MDYPYVLDRLNSIHSELVTLSSEANEGARGRIAVKHIVLAITEVHEARTHIAAQERAERANTPIVPVYAQGKRIGRIENGVFHKDVSGSKHFLRKPQAICFDVPSLAFAEEHGATSVCVRDIETGLEYRASTKLLRERGFPVNRGFGEQRGLIITEFNKPESNAEQPKLL